MHDHVTIGVRDLETSRAFYGAALTPLEVPRSAGDEFLEWGDFSIGAAGRRAVTRRAHFAFAARSREHVDAFWRAATAAGGADNGRPALRPHYHAAYYGAFVLDPDGNNVEAVFHGGAPLAPGTIDHVSLRVRNLRLARRFYETVLEPLGVGSIGGDEAVGFGGATGSLWLAENDPTVNLHFAFGARDNAAVDAFWEAGTGAGFIDNGQPGERRYHRGYYAAFLLDPDGNNVEAVCHNR